ncbi:cytosolic carboxypeptidase 4-like isoform X2 [Daktulosphaira vitifoliae]|uniref:cytosolic carboxypeptidase 4-like isoform X2 n=1 Tax=Daktulosphaira vitifoliae TaxID=58002 RepID=UPI0021AA2D58|nr:cytosolic carboxypeptidase 4-like isoform X2 [Daktulosphaira vitifoliae]
MVVSGDDHAMDVLLDRLAPLTAKTTENLEKIRKIACKLNGRVNNTDKIVKDKSLNILRKTKSEKLTDIIKLYEKSKDKSTCTYLAGVIRACVAPKSGNIRMAVLKHLVKLNASKIFMKSIVELQSKSVGTSDTLVNELFFILGELSQKDNNFSKHAEVLSVAKLFHQHLRNNVKNIKLSTSLMLCFKTITKNENIVGILLKDNFCLTMEKLLRENKKHLKKNKQWIFIVILANLSKKVTEETCDRLVRGGLMQYVLDIFDTKNYSSNKTKRKIFASALDFLVHISATHNGRIGLKKSNRLSVLYTFGSTCPINQIYNSTISKLCTIINVCTDKIILPLSSTQSSFFFNLGDTTIGDTGIEKYEGTDSDESDDESDINMVHNSLGPIDNLVLQKSESVKFEISLSYWKNLDELKPIYSRLFEEFDVEITNPILPYEIRSAQSANSTKSMIKSFVKLKSSKYNGIQSNSNFPEDMKLEKGEIKLLNNLRTSQTHKTAYSAIAKRVNTVIPLVKFAYPDWVGVDIDSPLEPFYNNEEQISRIKLINCLEQNINKKKDTDNLIVYDLDFLIRVCAELKRISPLSNDDEQNLNVKTNFDHLHFESRFESGNLRKVMKIGPVEYDLILNSDVNSSSHNQWFYFQVSNMVANKQYAFNIINMEKMSSQFKHGLQPIMFSVKSYVERKEGWKHTGTDICYYVNQYKNENKEQSSYMTASFTIQFPYDLDICYIAYIYPYTYSTLLYKCFKWKNSVDSKTTLFRANALCRSLNNNDVPILTITSKENNEQPIKNREIVYLTSRVHPGETNSSWVIDGAIEFLCSDFTTAKKLRNKYVFKIIPMLNVEGVINGWHYSFVLIAKTIVMFLTVMVEGHSTSLNIVLCGLRHT